ncbi:hypothetical protein FAUST_9954 [Fusarium austroamericanum]|uniref:Uncharacterized protein n=1 Tax=Fusarium austroamericanum TaxID=282268 RepID=A0AAN5Z1R1_FUSAU|nr:hypothetical protein FAUST_9954 [Fusarium austroamericanum]
MTESTQTWVVVGASRGIGLEFVKQLLEAGHRVIATVRDPNNAEQLSTVIQAQKNPKNCTVEQCDVTSSESIDNFAAKMSALVKSGTKLDNVIINAGVLKYPNRATEITFQDLSYHLTTNTIGPIICAQKLINLDPESPPSKVIFISSDSGSTTNFLGHEDGYAAYAASKSALNQALRHMALELKRRGGKWTETCILALHPGEVNTAMNSIDIPWDCGPLLEADESVRGMLNVVEEKKSEDSGTFWCWDGRQTLRSYFIMTEITAAIAHRKGKLEGVVTKALQAFMINGLASIHRSPEAKMTPTTYMELYTAISELINREEYTDCNTRGNLLYKAVSNFLAEYLQSVAQKLESHDDSALLSAYFAE